MPHCSKCGKMPPLGLKKLLKSFGVLLKTLYQKIAKLFSNVDVKGKQ
tara:strand:+ start:289 stop:429 length:141 start_codon:yes stop_codon:yes gene_type:complete